MDVDLLRHLESIRVGQIGVGWRHGQDKTRFPFYELQDHGLNLLLDVDGLISDGNFRQTREIDEC